MRYAMERLTGCVDSWGLNERECVKYLGARSESLEDLSLAAYEALKEYGLTRICVHASQFALACSRLPPEVEVEALTTACRAAAAQTMGGSLAEGFRKAGRLPRSRVGQRIERLEGANLIVVPAFVNPSPRILTGLGDCFAAVQAVMALCR